MNERLEKAARGMALIQEGIDNLPKGMNGDELMKKEFSPIPWVIPGLLTTGLTILAGPPKMGKSWLILGMACEIALGGRVFGDTKVQEGEVLYLALEDTERRLKDRLSRMRMHGLRNIHFRVAWPAGPIATQNLNYWMLAHPKTRVIFVDTLQKISGVEDSNSYAETYHSAAELKKIADKYSIAIVVIHHTNKAVNDDFVHTVLGSVGLTGAADSIVTLTRPRGQDVGTIKVTGRDVEEAEFSVKFEPEEGCWIKTEEVPEKPKAPRFGKKPDERVDGRMAAAGGDN